MHVSDDTGAGTKLADCRINSLLGWVRPTRSWRSPRSLSRVSRSRSRRSVADDAAERA
jgi:hypothetical protein